MTSKLPSAFESLAGLNKFLGVATISPDFFIKHAHKILFSTTFVKHFVSSYPQVEGAFREALPLGIVEGGILIHKSFSLFEFKEKDLNWFDTQTTEALKSLVPVVQDAELPAWLQESKWAIEGAFE
ncbi:MAG: hypothetical protein GZ093_14320 [Rhodoferax sp.]|uniref:hypothetical protein n=1 Tax=Rhodoferax sp. TaxID=50421 RepID=UPI0013FEBE8E|nr:hypothetical protein [Rhodoferax sp.]NDP39902.1 hypothetical protein [Rhodoferax sp.]